MCSVDVLMYDSTLMKPLRVRLLLHQVTSRILITHTGSSQVLVRGSA